MRHWRTVFLLLSPLLLVRCAPAPEPPIYVGCCTIPPLARSVYFRHGDATLNEASKETIRGVAIYLINRPEKRIEIVGHNDLSGGAEVDAQISGRRAEVVAAALIAMNVSRERVDVRAGGASDPRVPVVRGQKEPQNRRVDLNGSYP